MNIALFNIQFPDLHMNAIIQSGQTIMRRTCTDMMYVIVRHHVFELQLMTIHINVFIQFLYRVAL